MKVPETWLKLLEDLNTKYHGCVLAGGALRDLDLGLEPKDLDIFVSAGDVDEANEIATIIGAIPSDTDEFDELEGVELYPRGMTELIMVTELENNPLDIPVQIIFVNWLTSSIIDRFDFGICKIVLNGTEIDRHEDYKWDKRNKTMTVVRARDTDSLTASVERFVRWKSKFPDWSFRIGPHVKVETVVDSTVGFD